MITIECACECWLRGMACAVQHMHVMNAEELRTAYQCCMFGFSQFIDVGRGNIWICCLIFSAFAAFGKRPVA